MSNFEKELQEFSDVFDIKSLDLKSDRLFIGWASVEKIDNQDDKILIDAFKRTMDAWMERDSPMIDLHSNRPVSKGLAYKFLDKDGKPGVLVLGKVHDHYSSDNVVWNKIKHGIYPALSIGGKGGDPEKVCDELKCWNEIKTLDLMEISHVDVPANDEAVLVAVNHVAKSDTLLNNCTTKDKDQMIDFSKLCHKGNSEPCEGCSILGKSIGEVLKGEKFERCVKDVMTDPEFKPEDGRTKEESARAVCTESVGQEKSKSKTPVEGISKKTEEITNMSETSGKPSAVPSTGTVGKQEDEEEIAPAAEGSAEEVVEVAQDMAAQVEQLAEGIVEALEQIEDVEARAKAAGIITEKVSKHLKVKADDEEEEEDDEEKKLKATIKALNESWEEKFKAFKKTLGVGQGPTGTGEGRPINKIADPLGTEPEGLTVGEAFKMMTTDPNGLNRELKKRGM